jgi:oligopeptide transport system substrate-binding protein
MKKAFFLFCFLPLLFSCQKQGDNLEPKKKGISINILSDPTTLDPRKTRALNERILTNMLFEGLTRLDKEGKTSLALAEEVEISSDGKSYSFRLKEAYWSHGERIQPQDFIYAWQTALSPSFPSSNAYQLFCIKNAEEIKLGKKEAQDLGVYALDEKTLKIDLVRPVPYFLELLAFSIFFPVHPSMDQGNLVFSGPFVLKEWKHNDFIEVKQNPAYWDAKAVHLPSVYMTMVGEDTEMQMFEHKELDWAGSPMSTLPIDLLQNLKKEKVLHSSPMAGTVFFRVNTEKFPFHNKNIRKAFALAIHRQELVDHVIQGDQKVALRFLPSSPVSYFADGADEEARAFLQKGLQELGISKSELGKVTLLYASNQKNHLTAQAIQQDWKRSLDLDVTIEAAESKVYYSRIGVQDYQLAAGSWIADYNDPESFLEVFKYKNSSTNNTQWENPLYTSLLSTANDLKKEQRAQVLGQCETLLMEELPIIPLYHLNYLYLKDKNLCDVIISPLGNIDFKWAYFYDENLNGNRND